MVDRACRQRGARLQRATVKDKLQCRRRPHPLKGTGRPAIAGKKPQIDLRKSDLTHRIINGDNAIECQRQLQPAADADAVDQNHRRARQFLDFPKPVENLGDMRLDGRACLEAGEFVDVGAKDETARLSGLEHQPLWRRGGQTVDDRKQLGHDSMRQNVG